MTTDYLLMLSAACGTVIFCVFGYYALRILGAFRAGILQKGWLHVTVGALFMLSAQFPILASGVVSSSLAFSLSESGTALRLVGMIFLILGLRAHYLVWRLDTNKAREIQTQDIER